MVSPSFVGEQGWVPLHFLSPLQHFVSLNQLVLATSVTGTERSISRGSLWYGYGRRTQNVKRDRLTA
jgi:hypothetical protein